MFNKYLSVCEKTANLVLCSTLCSAISKNKVQTGQILDESGKGPATQNAVCRSGLRSLSAAECYILSRLF